MNPFRLFLALAALCVLAAESRAQTSDTKFAGLIERMEGHVVVRSPRLTDGSAVLDPVTNRFWRLFTGDRVECGKNSKATLRLLWGRTADVKPNKSFTVTNVISPQNAETRLIQNELNKNPLAGRPRAAGRLIQAPLDDSTIRPEKIILQWKPSKIATSATLWIKEGNTVVWTNTVPADSGSFVSQDLQRRVAGQRDAGAQRLMFEIVIPGHVPALVTFKLFDQDKERDLERDLDACAEMGGSDSSGKVLRLMARAAVLRSFDLHHEAIDEYEKILLLPEAAKSSVLIRFVSEQNDAFGYSDRAIELRSRLPR